MELFKKIAEQLLTDVNADGKVDLADVAGSLKNLLSDSADKLDIGSLITKLKDQGLTESVSSWLGEGENISLSADSITDLFDTDKLNQFATTLGVDMESAKDVLAGILPNLIDKASSGGDLLIDLGEKVGQVADEEAGGLLNKIKKLFS